jgi:hypothetical protein
LPKKADYQREWEKYGRAPETCEVAGGMIATWIAPAQSANGGGAQEIN